MVRTAPDDLLGEAAALPNEEIVERLGRLFSEKAAIEGAIVVLLGEVERRQAYRLEGATSSPAWTAERFGVSKSTARAYGRVADKAWDLPHLIGSLCAGDVSFDKVRALAPVATPESERELRDHAEGCSVRQLTELVRSRSRTAGAHARSGDEQRFLRFNHECRTMTLRVPPESYAETRACLEARAKRIHSDGETPWDERLCDAFMELIRSSSKEGGARGTGTAPSPYFVVLHVPLSALVEDSGGGTSLFGELERDGLLDGPTVRRIACDATYAIAVDDDVGHTMYEGRARREPTDAQRREVMRRDRHCRFPGCTHVTFTNTHHVVPWKPNGRTDIDNLALLCLYHHHLVHSSGWSLSGDANEELEFVGPMGRAMTSRPSPMWTTASAPPGSDSSG